MKKTILSILPLLLAALLLHEVNAAAQSRKERLAEYVYYFASDSLKGRAAGSPEAELARYYIVARYKECGLKPYFGGDFVLPFEKDGKHYANVLGVIEGNSLKDEYIVLGAHFDHLGIKNGKVYPGADDNASGSAALIEIARELCAHREDLQRSVIIAAFDAEEIGLYGSNALAEFLDATIGIDKVKLMMSIDMVGWYGKSGQLLMDGIATIKDGEKLVATAAQRHTITVKTKNFENSLFTATDTQGFAKKRVPTLAVTTGLKSPYHQPGDKPELIDYDGLDKVSGFLADFAVLAASDKSFASSGKIARKHEGKRPVFEGGIVLGAGLTSMRFADARMTTDADKGWNAGLMGRVNLGKIGFQANALYEFTNSYFPDLTEALGKAQSYSQQSITVPAYVLLQTGDSSSAAYVGFGGYYRYALRNSFSISDPGWGINKNQGGLAAVFGVQVGPVLVEWNFRWQLSNLFVDQGRTRLNYGSIINLGWVF